MALTSAIRDSIPSVAASSIFCSRSAAAACVELLAVAADEDEAPDDAGAVPGFGGRFMTLLALVEIRDPHKEVQKVRVCFAPLRLRLFCFRRWFGDRSGGVRRQGPHH